MPGPQGVSTVSEASAQGVAQRVRQIRKEQIKALTRAIQGD